MVADIYLLVKYAKAGPETTKQEPLDLKPSVVGELS
jgi:hypothetical protein